MDNFYLNKFDIIGKLININEKFIELLIDKDIARFFFDDSIDVNLVEIDKLTRIQGYIDFSDIVPKLMVSKLYQIKDDFIM